MIETQLLKGNLIKQEHSLAFTLNQYDKNISYKINLIGVNGNVYTLDNEDVITIEWLKPNGRPFLQSSNITKGDNYITLLTPEAISQIAGTGSYNIIITNGDTRKGTIKREYSVIANSMRSGTSSEDIITDVVSELRELSASLTETVQNNQEIINNNSAATKSDIASVNSSLEDIVNVLDKYVVNDGITDNTDIIQNALDNSNYIRISKKGTYVTRRLTIHDNTTFELADGVVLKQKDNNSDYMIVNDKWRETNGTYNTNIKIIGGQYDVNASKNPRTGAIIEGLYAGIGIVLNNVRNLEVKNIKEIGNALKYCCLFANIENGVFENINCINQSDGLHFQAPCKNIEVNNLTGTCHDNLLPFTIGDYPSIVLSEDGDFDNINIKNVYSKGETIDIIRFVGDGKNGTGAFRNIDIDNVQASCPSTGVVEVFNNDQATPNVYLNKTIIENIKISNIKNNSQTKINLINIWGQVKNIILNNISLPINTIGGTCISIFNTANVDNLTFKNSYVKNNNNGYTFLRVEQKTKALNATINNCKIDIKGSLIVNDSDVEHNINIINNQITCNRFATVTGKLKTFVNNNLINFTNPTTIANDSYLFLEGEKTIFNSSAGKRFRVDFGSTNSKMRVNSKDIIMTINIDNLSPTEGDFINFFNDLSTNRKKGLYRYINNRYIFIDGELTLYVQALDFGSIPANSSVVREADLSEFGINLTHDYKFGVVANAYNGTGENNNITYCAWLKDNKVEIRVSNLSATPTSIICDWLIKIIK